MAITVRPPSYKLVYKPHEYYSYKYNPCYWSYLHQLSYLGHVYVNALGPFGGPNHLQRPRRRSVRRGFVAWRFRAWICRRHRRGARRNHGKSPFFPWKITIFNEKITIFYGKITFVLWKITMVLMGKLTISNGPFSIAM